jgi:hypothetical protein
MRKKELRKKRKKKQQRGKREEKRRKIRFRSIKKKGFERKKEENCYGNQKQKKGLKRGYSGKKAREWKKRAEMRKKR